LVYKKREINDMHLSYYILQYFRKVVVVCICMANFGNTMKPVFIIYYKVIRTVL